MTHLKCHPCRRCSLRFGAWLLDRCQNVQHCPPVTPVFTTATISERSWFSTPRTRLSCTTRASSPGVRRPWIDGHSSSASRARIAISSVIPVERRFYISSLGVDPKEALRIVRAHWGIENKLHSRSSGRRSSARWSTNESAGSIAGPCGRLRRAFGAYPSSFALRRIRAEGKSGSHR